MTLALWIDPADDNKVTLSGSRITGITDKSVDANDVVEVSLSGPERVASAINNLPAMSFASGDYLTRVNASLVNLNGPDFTVFAVVTDNDIANSFGGIVAMTNAGFSNGWRIIKNTDFELSAVGQTPKVLVPDSDTAGNAKVIVFQNDQTRDYQWAAADGAFISSQAQTGTVVYDQDLRIGVNLGSFNYTSGYIADILYFDGVLPTDEIQRAEGFLAHKYSSNGSLPLGHPFRYRGPDIVRSADFIATFEGADGATSYTAETGQVATFGGNAQLDTAQAKFGGSSCLFDGTGDYITFPDSALWDLSNNDFTVEFWVRFNGDPGAANMALVGQWTSSGDQRAWVVNLAGNLLRWNWTTAGTLASSASSDFAWDPAGDTWYHIAITRHSDTLYFFVDGTSLGNVAHTPTYFAAASPLEIGALDLGTAQPTNGWIEDVRIINGTALYRNNFTVPHRSFRLPVAAALIANFNGLDAATAYTSEDAGARVATFVGNAQLDDAQRKFGHTSLLLDGTGDYVTFPDSPDFDPGANDFTIECWARFNTVAGNQYLVSKWGATGQFSWALGHNSANTLAFAYSSDGTAISSHTTSWTPTVGVWYHITVNRYKNLVWFTVDGVITGVFHSIGSTSIFSSTAPLEIGAQNAINEFDGHIDGVRVTLGECLYGGIKPLDDVYIAENELPELAVNFEGTNGQTSYTTDDASGFSLTFGGAGQISTAQRARGSSCLAAVAEADYANLASGNGLALGTGDFTIEFFVRFSAAPATSSYNAIVDNRITPGSSQARIYIGTASTSGNWVFHINGADQILGSGGAPSTNQWYHVVVERYSGITRFWVDGTQIGSDYTDSNNYLDGPWRFGGRWDGASSNNSMEGYLDAFRLSVGTALYNGDFPTPVAAPGEPII